MAKEVTEIRFGRSDRDILKDLVAELKGIKHELHKQNQLVEFQTAIMISQMCDESDNAEADKEDTEDGIETPLN